MTSPNAIVANTSTNRTSSSANQNTPNNVLGPDSFMTLLTAQLQAQDPLSPMDPDQMVNELTSINTLQQIIQIRTDMDTLVSSIQGTQSTSGSSSSGSSPSNSSVLQAAAKQYSEMNSVSQSN